MLKVLPGPGEALHAIISGRFDLLDLAALIIGKVGPVDSLHAATLAYARRNLAELVRLHDTGTISRLTLLCSVFFRRHNKDVWQETVEALRPRGARVAAARNHAKVIAFEFRNGLKLSLEGSANLRQNGNREQFCLVNDPGLCDWHAGWISELVSAHEGEAEND